MVSCLLDDSDADAGADGFQALLASGGDTLLIVRVTSGDGELQRVYIIRIRKPSDSATSTLRSSRSVESAGRHDELAQQPQPE